MTCPDINVSILSLLLIPCCFVTAGETTDWTQWRGPQRTGIVETAGDWPSSLQDESLQELWSVELGPSYSTPIVLGTRVFTTETVKSSQEVVRAFDRQTGAQLWETSWEGSLKVPFFAAANGSWIRSTPAADARDLYVAGIRDVLVCLDQETGQIRWKVDFVGKLGSEVPSFGFVSSPLIDGDFVYVQAGGGFVKINKENGEIVWRVLEDGGGMNGSAFSSPILTTINSVRQFVVQTRTDLAGVSPEDGTVLWKTPIEAFRGMNILTPVIYDNKIFTSSYGGGTFLLSAAISENSWETAQLWRNKLQGYMSTPILLGDHVYLHQRNKRFASIDLRTGKENWNTKPFGNYWSMVSNGKHLLALDSRGDLLLIDPAPEEFRLLDQRHISDATTWAHLVVAGKEVYVRALDRLHVFHWK